MELALENKVALMVVVTENGAIARAIARQRPQAIILACSVNSNVVRQANCCRGVIGYKVPSHLMQHGDKLVNLVLKVARE
jgi:pyruvate kinase